MGFSARGLKDPVKTYHDIEHSMRQTVIDNGGSLSHHHGIGKIRQGFLQQIESDANFAVVREAKRALDPKNIFAIRNNLIDGRES
jgi:alkyldihydroxyacetonephosphate synthase